MTADEAKEVVRSAFKPFACGVERRNEDLRFRVRDAHGVALADGKIGKPEFSSEVQLRERLERERHRLTGNGFTLAPWPIG